MMTCSRGTVRMWLSNHFAGIDTVNSELVRTAHPVSMNMMKHTSQVMNWHTLPGVAKYETTTAKPTERTFSQNEMHSYKR